MRNLFYLCSDEGLTNVVNLVCLILIIKLSHYNEVLSLIKKNLHAFDLIKH